MARKVEFPNFQIIPCTVNDQKPGIRYYEHISSATVRGGKNRAKLPWQRTERHLHIANARIKKYLKEHNEVYFYGEYNEISNNPEYVYKYWIEEI